MFAIIIQEKGGEQRRLMFDKPEVTIGRVQGNDIVLPKGNVSKRHARIVLKDGKFIIVDLKSTNGTYVNGRKITSPLVVKDSDKIYIGDFIMGVDESGGSAEAITGSPAEAPAVPFEPPAPRYDLPAVSQGRNEPPPTSPPPMAAAPMAAPAPAPAPAPRYEGGPTQPPPLGGPPDFLRPPAPAPLLEVPRPAPPGRSGPITAPPVPAPPMGERPRPPRPAPSNTQPPIGAALLAPLPPMPAAPSAPVPGVVAPAVAPAPLAERPAPRPRLVGAGAHKLSARPVPPPLRRGVQIEPLDAKVVKLLDLQTQILEQLRERLGLATVPVDRLGDEALWQKAETAVVELVEGLDSSGELPKYIEHDTLIKETLNEALGLGPLEDLLADDKLDEIIVDRRDRVVVGKDGQLRGSGKAFSSDEVLRRVIERLVAPTGRTINEASPIIQVRLRDGSQLTAAVPPVAGHGGYLVLRKSRHAVQTVGDMINGGAASAAMGEFLMTCITARRNILVCGGAGAGKTALAAALAQAAPEGERVVSVEEVAELALSRDEWVALETRPGDGKNPAIDLGHLIATGLRLRPDRFVVVDVNGGEAMPLIAALGSWVDGAIVTCAGEGGGAALGRLATLVRIGGVDEGLAREMVANAFDVAVHVARFADGTVRVVAIDEVLGSKDGGFDTQPLFVWRGGGDEGGYVATGAVPRFWGDLAARGVSADQGIFRA